MPFHFPKRDQNYRNWIGENLSVVGITKEFTLINRNSPSPSP